MALFPAYNKPDVDKEDKEPPKWLQNISFKASVFETPNTDLCIDDKVKDDRIIVEAQKKKSHKSKHSFLKDRPKEELSPCEIHSFLNQYVSRQSLVEEHGLNSSHHFTIDVEMGKPFCVPPLYKRAKSQKKDGPSFSSSFRYFKRKLENNPEDEDYRIQKLKESATNFNKLLTDEPNNIDVWLNYVEFQDKYTFEGDVKKFAQGEHIAIAEKKISILDKALLENPTSQKLLSCKYNILSVMLPFDQFHEQLFGDIKKEYGNITLWRFLITNTQYSLSRCTVPSVLNLYSKAIEKLKCSQKGGILCTEENIVDLYHECGLFLRQAGLWEQLCTLIQLYLQLNLPHSLNKQFMYNVSIPSAKINEYEEIILSSQLPVVTMWLRFERLRQKVYWCPSSDPNCDDPQRVVLPTDLTSLLQPVSNRVLDLHLAVYSLTLLKVPLLPFRQCSYHLLQYDKIPWFLDSSEILLAGYYQNGLLSSTSDSDENLLLSSIKNLVSSPQYVNNDLGQEEYQEFIYQIFKHIAECLENKAQTAVLIWWLRFECFLLTLENGERLSRTKRLKNLIKDLLKKETHRNNILLYIEYALIEKELSGNLENGLKILKTVINIHPTRKSLDELEISLKTPFITLYRVYLQLLLSADRKKECLELLVTITLGNTKTEINKDILDKVASVFEEVTDKCFKYENFNEPLTFKDIMLPHFTSEWIICWTIFLYLTESLNSTLSQLQKCIDQFLPYKKNHPVILQSYYREILSELRVSILHFEFHHNLHSYSTFYQHLTNSRNEYSNNMYLLNTYATLQLQLCRQWFRMQMALRDTDSCLVRTMFIVITICQLVKMKKNALDIQNSSEIDVINPSYICDRNRMNSLFENISEDPVVRHCILSWKLYLQYAGKYETLQKAKNVFFTSIENCPWAKYAGKYETLQKAKNVFFTSIENCPWAKTLYMEAASILPEEFSHIQELLVEKELRLHITQEEIEELKE